MKPIPWLVATVFTLVGLSCNSSKASAPATSQTRTVEVVQVISQPLETNVKLPGELQPYETVALLPRVSGFVDWIGVDRGSNVKAGQVLARLVAPELQSQRAEAAAKAESAHAQIASAAAKLAADRSTFEKLQAAGRTPGVVAGNDLLAAQKVMEADQEQVNAVTANADAARQALKTAVENEQYLRIVAPFDGIVTERNVHPGALVSPSQPTPMLRVESLNHLRLVVPVPETYAAGVPDRASVEFTVPSHPAEKFQGSVARNSHAVDTKTRTMAVELDVKNGSLRLAPGSFCEVIWPVRRANSLLVPPSAIGTNLERTFVVRVQNGKTEWVDVKQGTSSGKLVEIFGDIKPGDTVIARGTDEFPPGTSVSPKPYSTTAQQ